MALLPTFCPDCSSFTVEVVEYRGDDSYEAPCTDCGYRGFGKTAPELPGGEGCHLRHVLRNQLRREWPDTSTGLATRAQAFHRRREGPGGKVATESTKSDVCFGPFSRVTGVAVPNPLVGALLK